MQKSQPTGDTKYHSSTDFTLPWTFTKIEWLTFRSIFRSVLFAAQVYQPVWAWEALEIVWLSQCDPTFVPIVRSPILGAETFNPSFFHTRSGTGMPLPLHNMVTGLLSFTLTTVPFTGWEIDGSTANKQQMKPMAYHKRTSKLFHPKKKSNASEHKKGISSRAMNKLGLQISPCKSFGH